MFVKICGITTVEDARDAVSAGVDAIGVNFVFGSPRAVDVDTARSIRRAVDVRVVAVVADRATSELEGLRRSTGIEWLQLHGDEPPAALEALGSAAYKAVRIGSADDVRRAEEYGGDLVLVDARVHGMLGGTGTLFDWSLVRDLARQRPLVLAGGLRPQNVDRAVREVAPFGVDVSSGVEVDGDPRRKDPESVRAFVAAARGGGR